MAQGIILKPYFSLSAVQELLMYMLPFNMLPSWFYLCDLRFTQVCFRHSDTIGTLMVCYLIQFCALFTDCFW